MATLLDLLIGTKGGWAPDVQQTGVRPGFGLQGAGLGQTAKSPYERTLRPGEERTSEELQDMLAEVILAAGTAVLPRRVASPRPRAQKAWTTNATEDLHPEWDREQLAARAGIPSVSGGRAKDSPLYHFTAADSLAEIAKRGLEPRASDRVRGGRPGVYLADSAGILSSVGRDVETRDWALLRVRPNASTRSLRLDPEYDEPGAWIGRKPIPPESLDVWTGKGWTSLADRRSGQK